MDAAAAVVVHDAGRGHGLEGRLGGVRWLRTSQLRLRGPCSRRRTQRVEALPVAPQELIGVPAEGGAADELERRLKEAFLRQRLSCRAQSILVAATLNACFT